MSDKMRGRAMERELSHFALRGVGKALPQRRLSNEELGRALRTDPRSIRDRTGIEQRRIASTRDTASSLGAQAAVQALERAELPAEELDLVLLSTYTPDHLLCPTGPALAHRIGAHRAGAFDINGACSGGVTALMTASALLASGSFRRILVVTADVTTKYIRPDDPKTRLVFGDGASALVLETQGGGGGPAGPFWPTCWVPTAPAPISSGSRRAGRCTPPMLNGVRHEAAPSVEMDGRAVFRFGVDRGMRVMDELCERAGIHPTEVSWLIPHQANLRMLTSMIGRSAIPPERWVINIENYGNTASTSVPLALTELVESGRVRSGDVILLVAFGAGLTWSGMALRVD
ncbi:MAG: ketoacyl-ACP synthase III [Acidobacteriota bacterium]|nr:ketoacyl-ACP synthase III [Acidobacteriota bacterium]